MQNGDAEGIGLLEVELKTSTYVGVVKGFDVIPGVHVDLRFQNAKSDDVLRMGIDDQNRDSICSIAVGDMVVFFGGEVRFFKEKEFMYEIFKIKLASGGV